MGLRSLCPIMLQLHKGFKVGNMFDGKIWCLEMWMIHYNK